MICLYISLNFEYFVVSLHRQTKDIANDMLELSKSKVTLVNKRDGQERYTRYTLGEVVEMIRTGKLKSGRLLSELSELPYVCCAPLPDRQALHSVRQPPQKPASYSQSVKPRYESPLPFSGLTSY